MKELNNIKYIERKPIEKIDKSPLILLIHGFGSNEEDLFSFAEDLPSQAHVISVRAPHEIQYGGYAWYDIGFTNNEKWMDEKQAFDSKEKLVSFIDAITKQENLDGKNVTLIGFSQGAILSYAIALNNQDKVKNVGILSGYPEEKIIGNIEQNKAFSNLVFYVSHGKEDMVLPIEWGRRAEELLKSLHIKFEYHEYNSGHGVAPQNYFDLISWLNNVLSN